MTEEGRLQASLTRLGLPDDAIDYMCGLYNATQVFDDVEDGDHIEKEDLHRAIWWCLVGSTANPFFMRHGDNIRPIVANLIMKWHAANAAETTGQADEQSYMHRAGFYDVLLMVCHLAGCPAHPNDIMRIYGETYADYIEEFT